jgi:type IV pilus assembly protein PilY1
MNIAFLPKRHLGVLGLIALSAVLTVSAARAGTLSISDTPLFLNGSVAPLNMLVMGRDHKLYYEAYNDHSDLDNDGVLDITYKPTKITYYGYFNSFECYQYNSSRTRFDPVSAADKTTKACSDKNWSGDWLNYVTTSRIDALRKVLYGGLRSTDSATRTVLERSYIPQDAHSWGKSYESVAVNGYDISQYTPYSIPADKKAHLFANTTQKDDADQKPLLRVLLDQQDGSGAPLKIWNWVSIERPVANTQVVTGSNNGSEIRSDRTPTDFVVRVRICDPTNDPGGVDGMDKSCKPYANGGSTIYKPTGLLQDFGESDSMKFGLITGSYAKNTDGGVLRKAMGSIKDEINTNGTFNTATVGIIASLNRIKITGFGGSYQYDCGWKVSGPIIPGECQMWGNPIAEMMYEGLRYFAGKKEATTDYAVAFGGGEESKLSGGGLPVATWDDPYGTAPWCAKPFETVISDINPSYDSDKLPGSAFNSWSGNNGISGLNVADLGQKMWDVEVKGSKNIYVGRSMSDSNDDKAPTPKNVTSFGNIRGLAPEEPTKEGSYYSGSVAWYGATNDLNPATGAQKVQTFAVALASPLPRIEIPLGTDKKITLVPFAKTVGGSVSGSNVSADSSGFQPTNQIVDFYVDQLDADYGRFRVNYEDVEQGADHDMDAIVQYEYKVNGDKVDVTLTSQYAAGSLIQHVGYVISGTDGQDGTYFEVRDTDTAANSDPDYYLDTPDGYWPNAKTGTNQDKVALPLVHKRTFTAGATAGAEILKDPLWYAAKWGGFDDSNGNNIPDKVSEWDDTGKGVQPNNYFLVTNALTLGAQLTKAFSDIIRKTSSASSASVNSGSISGDTRVFQARFKSGDWTGELLSFPVNTDGSLAAAEWNAQDNVPAATDRVIITTNLNSKAAVPFRWGTSDVDGIGALRQAQLYVGAASGSETALGTDRLNFLRGDQSKEGAQFRQRVKILGDMVNSSPVFVGKPPFGYSESNYGTFAANNKDRQGMVYVGGNDGMLHGFNADNKGTEVLAFIPSPVFRNLPELTKPAYAHRYYVDGTPSMGDVYDGTKWHTMLAGGLNKGGQGIYMLDVTDPTGFSEAKATDIYKWEFTDNDDADLGYTYSRPAIVKVRSGAGTKWAVIFGNGYNNTFDDTATGGKKSSTGNAALYIRDALTGAPIGTAGKISIPKGTADDPSGLNRPNGLATPAVVDVNGDGIADYVFAGDLFGNMWKIDLTNTNPDSWSIAFGGSPLFVAKDGGGKAQPITERPEVGRGPNGKGLVVLFGTGKFLEGTDKVLANLSTQTFYGLFDPNDGVTGAITTSRAALTKQEITYEAMVDFKNAAGTVVNTLPVRGTTQNAVSGRGWYMDLLSGSPGVPAGSGFKGEMQVSDPILRNGRVIFSTIIPSNDPCSAGGSGWLMVMDALSGGRVTYPPLDANNDKKFDSNDYITVDGKQIPLSGVSTSEGMVGKAGVLSGQDGEYAITSGSTGDIGDRRLNPGPGDVGRQSWRQLR